MTLRVRTRFRAWLNKILGVDDSKRKQEEKDYELWHLQDELCRERHNLELTKDLLRLRRIRIIELEREIAQLLGIRYIRAVNDSEGKKPR